MTLYSAIKARGKEEEGENVCTVFVFPNISMLKPLLSRKQLNICLMMGSNKYVLSLLCLYMQLLLHLLNCLHLHPWVFSPSFYFLHVPQDAGVSAPCKCQTFTETSQHAAQRPQTMTVNWNDLLQEQAGSTFPRFSFVFSSFFKKIFFHIHMSCQAHECRAVHRQQFKLPELFKRISSSSTGPSVH